MSLKIEKSARPWYIFARLVSCDGTERAVTWKREKICVRHEKMVFSSTLRVEKKIGGSSVSITIVIDWQVGPLSCCCSWHDACQLYTQDGDPRPAARLGLPIYIPRGWWRQVFTRAPSSCLLTSLQSLYKKTTTTWTAAVSRFRSLSLHVAPPPPDFLSQGAYQIPRMYTLT